MVETDKSAPGRRSPAVGVDPPSPRPGTANGTPSRDFGPPPERSAAASRPQDGSAGDGAAGAVEALGALAGKTLPAGLVLQCGIILVAVTVTAFLIHWAFGAKAAQASWVVQSVLGVVTVGGICWGAWQRYRLWTLPMRRLTEVVDQIRQGELPLEALSGVEGVPGVLVPVLREVLIELKSRRLEITKLEQEMSQRVANRTDALERMLGSLREKASRDPLTGLYNRRMLDESLPKLIDRPGGRREPLTVLMIDVDNFKTLNDTLGHAAGDDLLRSIGQIIRSTARESDLSFRCGGDEFVIVLDGNDGAAGHALADRLISLVDGLGRTLRVPKQPRLSIGVAELRDLPPGAATAPGAGTALLDSADQALYKVKKARKQQEAASPQGAAPLQATPGRG